jgi:hypothetical protein
MEGQFRLKYCDGWVACLRIISCGMLAPAKRASMYSGERLRISLLDEARTCHCRSGSAF